MWVISLLTLSQIANGLDYVGSLLVAGIVSMTLDKIAKKKNIKWLKEWGMGFAVLAGMVGSVVVNFIALGIVILFGNWLLGVLPEGVKIAFNYAMPAVFGSLIAVIFNMFGGSKKKEEPKEEATEA